MTKKLHLQMTTTSDNKETFNGNIPLTARNIEAQAPKWPRPQRLYRKIDQKSNWSDSEDGKDDQARSNPIDNPPTQDIVHNLMLVMQVYQPH